MPQDETPPFRQFVLKVHSRCDLACDYCYMYEHADQSWKTRTKVLSVETAALVGRRIADHAVTHRLPSVRVIMHGGEPLLAGLTRLEEIIGELTDALAGIANLDLRIHTNGVKLTADMCELFVRHGVKIGISLDGDRTANDRHRRYLDGRSSFDRVQDALDLLRTPEFRHLYSGILCTIDIGNDPIAVYEGLLAQQPPRIDLLLPHSTWDTPPPRPSGAPPGPTPYADWLIAIHDRWVEDGRPMGIRVFDSVASTLAGGPPLTEALGTAPSDVVVIETDGEIEQLDSLKVAFDGAPSTGFNVLTDSLEAVLDHPGVRARQHGVADLCQTCQDCPVVTSCGGGLYPHRYRAGNGFDNPSVYCEDLRKLIDHIADGRRSPAVTSVADAKHVVAADHLAGLAAGFGDAASIEQLAEIQASVNRQLLAAVGETLAADDSEARRAWNLITDLDVAHGHVLARTLRHPYFRSWAVRVLGEGARAGDAARLGALATTAAVTAGVESDLTVIVPAGDGVYLPGLGRYALDTAAPTVRLQTTSRPGTVVFRVGRDRHEIAVIGPGPRGMDGWHPVRRATAHGFEVRIEDCDPERDCHQYRPADRLSTADLKAWQETFVDAWSLILRDHPVYAPGLAAGLVTLTPLKPAPSGRDISATARQAPGAIAAALPAGPDLLALLLIHEYQPVKMGAVLDCFDLYDEADTRLHYAPWRDDPRPLEGLLQGTYAHVAVADFWRVQRHRVVGAEQDAAEAQFARWRRHTADAVEVLAASGSLTSLGLAFTDAMRETLEPWLAEPVAETAENAAREASERHLRAYRARLSDAAVV